MIYFALFAHYVNDFLGQSFLFKSLEIGKNKSKSWSVLLLHILLYTTGMTIMLAAFEYYLYPQDIGLLWPVILNRWGMFALINGLSHMAIDAITSRISSYAYAKGNTGLFWATIGFDQFLHVAILIASLS